MPVESSLWAEVAAKVAPPMPPAVQPQSPIQQRRRRGYMPEMDDEREVLELVRDDGILRWAWHEPRNRARDSGRRSWRAMSSAPSDLVQRFEYRPPGMNRITDQLQKLDKQLNPHDGLCIWRENRWCNIDDESLAALTGRALLLVHGTFSSSKMYSDEFNAPGWCGNEGSSRNEALWNDWTGNGAERSYAAVLAFDHPTLSMGPWLNALDLQKKLAPAIKGERLRFDIVSHSRGGLVVAWALRLIPSLPVDRVVFVGSPLMGTSLAAPDRLAVALDLLANVANAIGTVSEATGKVFAPAMPLALGVAGIAKIVGRPLQLGSSLPIADAAVGLVPGLMAQSRVANSMEIPRLFPLNTSAKLMGIGCEFMPDEIKESKWKFWRRFSNMGDQAKYVGADIIFNQPNDLVVDVDSMNQLGSPDDRLVSSSWCNLGASPRTHHCSYFRDERIIDFLRAALPPLPRSS